MSSNNSSSYEGMSDLAARITKAASLQTYYTIRFLVDRERVQDAFRAYAYYRWVDDHIDTISGGQEQKITFIERQQTLLETCYRGEPPGTVCPEEQLLAELIANDGEKDSRLQVYLRDMMKVMAFDAQRRHRIISQAELGEYTHWLASAIIAAMFYFIDPHGSPPVDETRCQAVYGAHIVHMLRDAEMDISAGYYNIPGEFLNGGQITLENLNELRFRKWVFERASLARRYFKAGRKYAVRVKNMRWRLACYAYLARFEWLLRTIEQDGYYLRSEYPQRKSFKAALWMVWRIFASMMNIPWLNQELDAQGALIEVPEE